MKAEGIRLLVYKMIKEALATERIEHPHPEISGIIGDCEFFGTDKIAIFVAT